MCVCVCVFDFLSVHTTYKGLYLDVRTPIYKCKLYLFSMSGWMNCLLITVYECVYVCQETITIRIKIFGVILL